RFAALIVDVRAPADALSTAISQVKTLLERLPQALTERDLARARAAVSSREEDARTSPRRRLIDLWSGNTSESIGNVQLATFGDWLSATVRESSFVVVEGRP